MNKLPEQLTTKLVSETKQIIEMIDRKDDIRLILARFRGLSTILGVYAEMFDDPETRFLSFTFSSVRGTLEGYYCNNAEEWYKLNQKNIEDILPPLKKYASSLDSSLRSEDFNGVVNASKDFFYAAWKHITILPARG